MLTGVMGESDVKEVGNVDVLVESFLDEILRLVAGQVSDARVEKDEAQVERGAKHEHVRVQFQFRDGRRRQRLANRHQAHVLQADAAGAHRLAVARCVIRRHGKRSHLEVPRAVNHLFNQPDQR